MHQQIKAYMKRTVYTIAPDASLREAAEQLVRNKIGTLPVIEPDRSLVGLLQMRTIIALVMPDFVHLIEDFSFLHDFGAIEDREISAEKLSLPVKTVMDPPVSIEESSGLFRGAAMLNQLSLSDIPVVDQKQRVVGIISKVDVGTALLRLWGIASEE